MNNIAPIAESDERLWPEDLDAMTAAPDNHALLLENDKVRVLDSLLRPGESTPVHTHRWPSAQYVIGLSHFVRRDGDGNICWTHVRVVGFLRLVQHFGRRRLNRTR